MIETEVLPATQVGIRRAVALLKAHQPVVFPTETVYGLGARVFDPPAIQKIYQLKGRPSDNPLIVHLSSVDQVPEIVSEVPASFERLAAHFFPGPLTIILKKDRKVPNLATANLDTVAFRMPDHPIAYQLIKATGPLVAPSANLSGKPSPTNLEDVLEDLQNKVAAVIDGGVSQIGIESTVLDLTQTPPVILRPGSISAQQLEAVLQQPVIDNQVLETTTSPNLTTSSTMARSPGTKYRHYAPKTLLVVADNWSGLIKQLPNVNLSSGRVLTNIPDLVPIEIQTRPLNAATMYAEFRAADRDKISFLGVILDPITRKQTGLLNRLFKASAKLDSN